MGEGGGNLRSLYVRLIERHAPADIKVHGVAELNHRFRAPLLLHYPQRHSSLVVGIGLAACTLAPDAALLHSVYGNAAQVIVIQPFHLHIALILRVEHARKPFQIIDEPFQSLHVGEIILKFMSMLHKLLRGEQNQAVPVFSLQIIHLLFQQILELPHSFQVRLPTALHLFRVIDILGFPGQILHHAPDIFRICMLYRPPPGQIGHPPHERLSHGLLLPCHLIVVRPLQTLHDSVILTPHKLPEIGGMPGVLDPGIVLAGLRFLLSQYRFERTGLLCFPLVLGGLPISLEPRQEFCRGGEALLVFQVLRLP